MLVVMVVSLWLELKYCWLKLFCAIKAGESGEEAPRWDAGGVLRLHTAHVRTVLTCAGVWLSDKLQGCLVRSWFGFGGEGQAQHHCWGKLMWSCYSLAVCWPPLLALSLAFSPFGCTGRYLTALKVLVINLVQPHGLANELFVVFFLYCAS